MIDTIFCGDARTRLLELEDQSVQCVVTSPPYWALRDYGCEGQLGHEATPEAYVADLVKVFREVRRVLKDDGTLWLNLGDSYCGSWGNYRAQHRGARRQRQIVNGSQIPNPAYDGSENWRPPTTDVPGLKKKDLIGIPWMVAFALRADGWYLRSEIIWAKPAPMPESVTDRPTKSHEQVFLLAKSGEPQLWVHRDRAYRDCVYVEPEPDYRWLNNITKEEMAIEPAGWRTLTYILAGKEVPLWTRRNLWRGCDYYYDTEAIKEPANPASNLKWERNGPCSEVIVPGQNHAQHRKDRVTPIDGVGSGRHGDQERLPVRPRPFGMAGGNRHGDEGRVYTPRESVKRSGFNGKTNDLEGREAFRAVTETRNKRDVWTVAFEPCHEAHFAMFPSKLIEPCILAGTPRGGGRPRSIHRIRDDCHRMCAAGATLHRHRPEPEECGHVQATHCRHGRAAVR